MRLERHRLKTCATGGRGTEERHSEGLPEPGSRRCWPSEARMAKRGRHRVSAGQDARSERPATGRGQPRAIPPAHKKTDPAAVRRTRHGVGVENSGDTYSRAFGTTIGSGSLTTVFGMGTGVTFQIWSPEISCRHRRAATEILNSPPQGGDENRGRGNRHAFRRTRSYLFHRRRPVTRQASI